MENIIEDITNNISQDLMNDVQYCRTKIVPKTTVEDSDQDDSNTRSPYLVWCNEDSCLEAYNKFIESLKHKANFFMYTSKSQK